MLRRLLFLSERAQKHLRSVCLLLRSPARLIEQRLLICYRFVAFAGLKILQHFLVWANLVERSQLIALGAHLRAVHCFDIRVDARLAEGVPTVYER